MKKNKRVIILLSVLILGIGVSLAYFVGKTIFKGTGATTEGSTATVNGSTLDISGNINFGDKDIYPGHQTLSKVTATATGNNELIAYNLTWVGTNDLNTNLKYKVYVSEEEKEIELKCEKKKKVVNGIQQLNEECTINGELGEPINEGEISKTTEEQTIKITNTEFITAKEEGTKKYYYIIVEYPDNGNQSIDIGEKFEGRVYGEISNTKADINILGYFIKNEDTGKYEETEVMPGEEYEINTEASQCSNGAKASINYEDNSVNIKGLTINGTTCYLYYDKIIPAADKTLANLGIKSDGILTANITGPSCNGTKDSSTCFSDSKSNNMAENGVYTVEDDFGNSYVFRGEVDNNWVKFGKKGSDDIWWRIIRINGNGTIRLIYAGTGSSAPATNTNVTQIGTNAFNSTYSDNRYVGFMYNSNSNSSQVALDTNPSDSSIKGKLDSWWTETNLEASPQVDKIDVETGFCNDRGLSAADHGSYKGPGGGTGTTQTAYAPWDRLLQSGTTDADTTQRPSLKCANPTRDLFTGQNSKGVTTSSGTIVGNKKLKNPIGLITSDEVVLAGGFMYQNNNKYWLYTDQAYWTMSPLRADSSGYALVFFVDKYGYLSNTVSDTNVGVRPVINLSADTTFTGTGKSGSPFVPK